MGFGVTSYSPPAVGILSANVAALRQSEDIQNQSNAAVYQFRYDAFKKATVAIDANKLLDDYIDPINELKVDIQDEGKKSVFTTYPKYYSSSALAESAVVSIYGISLSDRQALYNLVGLSPAVGTIAEGSSVGTFDASNDPITGTVEFQENSSGVGNINVTLSSIDGVPVVGKNMNVVVGVTSYTVAITDITYVGKGQIYDDIIVISYYPDMEPPDGSSDNPYADNEQIILDSNNEGVGVSNTYYKNSLESDSYGDFVPHLSESLPLIGDVYAFDTSSNSSGASRISDDVNEVGTTRVGIDSYVDGSTTVKGMKKDYSLSLWSDARSSQNNLDLIAGYEAAISVLEDPSMGGPF